MKRRNLEARTVSLAHVNSFNLKRNDRRIAQEKKAFPTKLDMSFLNIRDARHFITGIRKVAKVISDDLQSGKCSLEEVTSNFKVKNDYQLLKLAEQPQSASNAELKRKQSDILNQLRLLSACDRLVKEEFASQIEAEFQELRDEIPAVLKTLKIKRVEEWNREVAMEWDLACFGQTTRPS